jgi:hypothetical protein
MLIHGWCSWWFVSLEAASTSFLIPSLVSSQTLDSTLRVIEAMDLYHK